eukprot:TRINITY_DN10460_c0_g1_i1.p1 TRINITY_DN10460_c0_g1~~TRINITY_DN10460_c0_g1_i1.p1  ORF type:complete len:604 (+),score=138.83 TRINITY_DN10460_c0_g1_i1:172-1983(+)
MGSAAGALQNAGKSSTDVDRTKVLGAFQSWDTNDDGKISHSELKELLTKLDTTAATEQRIDAIIGAADRNKDGSISYKEFVDWVFSSNTPDGELPRIALDYRELLPERFQVDIKKRYNLDKSAVGQGAFGKVFVARDREFSNQTVVVKMVTTDGSRSRAELFKREIGIMKELDHPNICKLLGTFEQGRNTLYYVMEFCEGGEVFDRIIEQKRLTEQAAADIVRQVASALNYAHGRGICHRDIKPENVVFCNKDHNDTSVKVIDWGLGMYFEDSNMKETVGSTTYCAPEVLAPKGAAYSQACDVWSLGVLAYVMLCGKPPFWGRITDHLRNARNETYPFSGNPWDIVSPQSKDFVRKMMKADPAARPPMDKVCAHEWLHMQDYPDPPRDIQESILGNLRQFSGLSTVAAMCTAAVARQLDHTQLSSIHQVFRKLDRNGDGVLSLEEIADGFGQIYGKDSPNYKAVVGTFKGLDLDGSNKIDYTEFCAGGLAQQTVDQEEACWVAFQTFDTDHTGSISPKELGEVLKSTDLQQAWSKDVCSDVTSKVFTEYDVNGDGKIDFQEFVRLMRESRRTHSSGIQGDNGEALEAVRMQAYDLLRRLSDLP